VEQFLEVFNASSSLPAQLPGECSTWNILSGIQLSSVRSVTAVFHVEQFASLKASFRKDFFSQPVNIYRVASIFKITITGLSSWG
jgi:hypothetical protein